ncbi:hypothetical protein OFO99_36440, partial [Escherichia coli]|nr:hypothetical protein [Escherichia coli]
MEYYWQFRRNYAENSQFSLLEFMEGNEPSQLRLRTLDADMQRFLSSIVRRNFTGNDDSATDYYSYDNNTIVLF